MLTKKSVVILVILAIILAGIAIVTNLTGTEEVSTDSPDGGSSSGGEIGINIIPSPVEDKLANEGQS